ncbi:aquaporin AQPAn.G isoform X2 [Linepithema humile]|uniref:aquaporin AQPAn.G isoform X2 n=1 Tax=Linepithema humile TaxID=83485 RepID=UPI0006237817|nr:PREDICTED: aquaporin AQPAn.G isoform X2 [Linepithema humile]
MHRNMRRSEMNFTSYGSWKIKPGGMNVSTVFPEGYVENERTRRQTPPIPKEIGELDLERFRRVKEFVGLEEVSRLEFLVMLFAEVLGTFLLVLIGCASCIKWATTPNVLHIAFTFGLAVASLAQALGPISGCHVNPAVSFGLMVSGNCTFLKTVSYVVCQCCGAIAGSAVLKMMIPKTQIENGLGATMLGPGVSVAQGVVMEAIVTFLLVLVVHAVTDPKRTDTKGWAPLAIGLTIAVAHMAAVPITGSSMNPARTLGPAVVEDNYQDMWVYWVGPLIGGCVAGGVYRMALRANKEDDEGSYDF